MIHVFHLRFSKACGDSISQNDGDQAGGDFVLFQQWMGPITFGRDHVKDKNALQKSHKARAPNLQGRILETEGAPAALSRRFQVIVLDNLFVGPSRLGRFARYWVRTSDPYRVKVVLYH